jgi:hypothetical protein
VAAESLDAFIDGVYWVPLAAVTDPEIVETTIGETIGAHGGLADHVDEKHMLILLDNLEQLLPEVAPPLAVLLERCPNLRLLLTSRARFGSRVNASTRSSRCRKPMPSRSFASAPSSPSPNRPFARSAGVWTGSRSRSSWRRRGRGCFPPTACSLGSSGGFRF